MLTRPAGWITLRRDGCALLETMREGKPSAECQNALRFIPSSMPDKGTPGGAARELEPRRRLTEIRRNPSIRIQMPMPGGLVHVTEEGHTNPSAKMPKSTSAPLGVWTSPMTVTQHTPAAKRGAAELRSTKPPLSLCGLGLGTPSGATPSPPLRLDATHKSDSEHRTCQDEGDARKQCMDSGRNRRKDSGQYNIRTHCATCTLVYACRLSSSTRQLSATKGECSAKREDPTKADVPSLPVLTTCILHTSTQTHETCLSPSISEVHPKTRR